MLCGIANRARLARWPDNRASHGGGVVPPHLPPKLFTRRLVRSIIRLDGLGIQGFVT